VCIPARHSHIAKQTEPLVSEGRHDIGCHLCSRRVLLAGFFWPGSISDPVFAGMLIILDVVLIIVGLMLLGLGVLFQKIEHDEWLLWGVQPPRGPQIKCVRCGGLMNVDTRECPFCGAEMPVEPFRRFELGTLGELMFCVRSPL